MNKDVNDIFRMVDRLNEISEESKEQDKKRLNTVIRKMSWNDNNEFVTIDVADKKDFMTFAKEAIGQTKLEIRFRKLDKRAVIPTYAHNGDVGMDLTAIDVEYNSDIDCYIYHTGLSFESDFHYGIFLFPRSSNRETEVYLCNHVGIVDSATYRGEIMLCFKDRTSLKQRALESKMEAFFNSIEKGKSIEEAIIEGNIVSKNVYNNPLIYAPYEVGKKIAQMVVLPHPDVKLVERQELTKTERGAKGFGSTDKK